ncbi:SH3 domain-containing protein [Nocardioides marmoribigeumensis]|uniref:ARB-07466-like C-terminal domain-containing protein n=1 Tax=Nocardioides marmoribigeumensis TaxID=433649 RepID=A0ABU2BS96_9ACTN|nr:SH3 domain-containing protein [Nocardioides marmoribigeumensis]MDR7360854.1 hypothetical protein [Nocardioides marmoribigeumensis]
MPPQRETHAPRPEADAAPSPTALVPAEPGLRTTLRTLGARAALLTATTLPVVAGPFFLTSAASPHVDRAAAALSAASGVHQGAGQVDPVALAQREQRASRSMTARELVPVTMKPRAVDQQWATAPLNVWAQPGEKGKRLGLLKEGGRVAVTGQTVGHWAEALVGGRARWVNADYLADKKPAPAPATASGAAPAGGISGAPCPDGSGTESGITSNAVVMFRAVCDAFPALTTYGGYDAHGEHADGRAVDFMVSDSGLGSAVAEWARANAGALHIRTIIWSQRIWTPERSAEGWRSMSDRGSATANHFDHVHISVY